MSVITPQIKSFNFKLSKASADSYPVYYYDFAPTTTPPSRTVICAHAMTHNGRMFDFLAHELASKSGYRVIAIDYPGRNLSASLPSSAEYNYDTYVQVFKQLFEHENLAQVDWIGTSMGGTTALLFENIYPGIIKRLVLNDMGPFFSKQSLKAIFKYTASRPNFSTLTAAQADLTKRFRCFKISDSEHFDHIFRHMITQMAPEQFTYNYDVNAVLGVYPDGGQTFDDIDVWHLWPAITQPTLLLRGEKSVVVTPQIASRMQQSHSTNKLKIINYPATGHCPSLMDPTQIKDVAAWLAIA